MEEVKFSELDLSFTRLGNQYTLGMRFLKAGEDAPREIDAQVVQIDPGVLDDFDSEAYGRTLASQVFGLEKLRTTLGEWMAVAAGAPLRIQIKTSPDVADLHAISWEKLRDPLTDAFLTTSENTWLSRYPASQDRRPVVLRPKGALKALAVAANPSDLLKNKLAPVDADAEITQARQALGEIPAQTLGNSGAARATLENIFSAMRDGVDVLYLACHGVMTGSGPILFLEAEDGKMARTKAEDFVTLLAELEADHLPRLIVLASCESAGKENAGSLAAFGPRLAAIGVPAVLAMQGKISMRTAEKFMPVFFKELNRDGQIDRALAVARSSVREQHDAWMPVLFLRSISGLLWDETRQERFTADQVQALIGTIKADFQPKEFKGDCPYVGLAPFEEENADLFFGRERLVDELLERVQESRGVFIAGPSGSGKSSLIRAGFIPALKKAENSKLWKYATLKPGRNPLLELQRALERVALPSNAVPGVGQPPDSWQEVARQLLPAGHSQQFVQKAEALLGQVSTDATRQALASLFAELGFAALQNGEQPTRLAGFEKSVLQNPTALHEVVETILGDRRKQRLVLLIDQFEELFTQVDDEKIRQAFISALEDAVLRDEGRIVLILTMRSDFVPNFAAYPQLNSMLNKFFFQVGLMTPEELVRSIVLPAQHVNLEVEPGLVSQIINDMGDEPGTLPLMQFALKDLFESQKVAGNLTALTLDGYLQRGGIYKALERHANAVFARLNPEQQELARSIFIGLVEAGSGDQLTRRTALFSELVFPGVDAAEVEKVIRSLTDDRLLTTSTSDDKNTVTLAHEKLITAWGWLKKLANEKRAVIEVNSEVLKDADNWNKNGRKDDYLYRGAQLANVNEKLQAGMLTLNSLALEFVQAGQGAYADALEQEKKRANYLEQLNKLALSRQLVAQAQTLATTRSSKQMLATLLAIQSMKLSPTSDGSQVLLNYNCAARPVSRMTQDASVNSVAFSPDGKHVVSCSNFVLHLWETETGKEIFSITYDTGMDSVAYSPDGKHIISRNQDLTWRILEAKTGKEVACMTHADTELSASFTPKAPARTSGKYVAFGSQDAAHVWEAGTGKKITRISHNNRVTSVAFSPDGKYVVSGSDDNTARVWDVETGQEIACINHEYGVLAVAFSPASSPDTDEMYIASGSVDGTAYVWEAKTGEEIASMNHDNKVTFVDFSSDGRYVVSGSDDNVAYVWEAKTGNEIARMTHDGGVTSVDFSSDGRYVVSGSDDNTVRVWETKTSKDLALMDYPGDVNAVVFSPGGKYIAAGGDDNTVRVCETQTGKEVARMEHDSLVWSVAFSPDEKYIVSGGDDGTARVWETGTGKEIARMTHAGQVIGAFFSSSGKYIVSGGGDHTACVWEAKTGKEIARMTHGENVSSIAFSPSGKYVVSGSIDNIVLVWETETGKEIVRMTQHDPHVVIFSPDGRHIAIGGKYGVSVNDAETGKEIAFMTCQTDVWSVAFSPDGKRIVSGSADATARVWEVETGKEIARMTYDFEVTSVAFSPDTSSGTGGAYVVSGGDNVVRVWAADTGKEIAHTTHDRAVKIVAFSPDSPSGTGGKYVVSGSLDGAVRVWAWQPADLINNACKVMPRNLNHAEWMQYIGEALPYQAVCEDLSLKPAPTADSSTS